jgi:hypothetical protein
MNYIDQLAQRAEEIKKQIHGIVEFDQLKTPRDFHDADAELSKIEELVKGVRKNFQWHWQERSRRANDPSRPNKLLLATGSRLAEIPTEIDGLKRAFQIRENSYKERLKNLRAQGIPDEKIHVMLEPVTDADRDELAQQVQTLEAEARQLDEFVRSSCSDLALLMGTALEHLIAEAAA